MLCRLKRIITLLLVIPTSTFAAPGKKQAPKATYAANKVFKEIIEKQHRDFEECGHAEVLRTKRKVKGTVLIRFVVNGDGKVTESGPVHNTTKSRYVADCLIRTLEQIKFPATFGAPVMGSHPFKFNLKK